MKIQQLRDELYAAALEGTATYIPAGARTSAVAKVAINGVIIGEAIALMVGTGDHRLEAAEFTTRFREVPVVTHKEFHRLAALPENSRTRRRAGQI